MEFKRESGVASAGWRALPAGTMTTRRIEAGLFLLLWISFAWFHHSAPGWNVNSRLALTLALVEQGTVRLDDQIHVPPQRPGAPQLGRGPLETGDAATRSGHLYSDKIIGTSLLGVPAALLVRGAEKIRGQEFSAGTRRWIITAFSVGLLGAAAGVLLFRLLLLLFPPPASPPGVPAPVPWGPLVLTCLTLLGTQLWFYATLFMSYLPSAFFLLAALLRFERWCSGNPAGSPPASPPPPAPFFTCGLLMGAAVLCEYLAAIGAGFFALYMVIQTPLSPAGRLRGLALCGAGGLLALSPFLLYTLLVFGRISVPYEFHVDPRFRHFMSRGLMGATVPDLDALILITVHPYRGLFVHSPWLLAGLAGLGLMIRRSATRPLGLLAAGVVTLQLLYNSAYYMWWGGWSFGARHLIPALPFLTIGAGAAWAWGGRAMRGAIFGLGVLAVGLHLVVNAVEPQVRDIVPDPRSPLVMTLPWLLEPDLSENNYPWLFPRVLWPAFVRGDTDLNLGRVLGLPPGWPSLVPLAALWGAGIGMLAFSLRKRRGLSSRRL